MHERAFIQRHLLLARHHGKDLQEHFLIGTVDLDLEEDPAQRGAVEDFIGVEVGGKDHQRVEGHGELLTRLQLQDVAALFQGHDPAVHQLLRRFGLTAKVVNDEDAAGGLELQGRGIGPRGGVVFQVQHVERQFAPGDHRGPFAAHIAVVKAVSGAAQRVRVIHRRLGCRMDDRVIDGDNLARILNGAGHIDLVTQGGTDAVRDGGLAVAGRAIHQD